VATIQSTLLSERWLDEIVIIATKTDIDAVQADEILLPAGLGDVAIMCIDVRIQTIDVLTTTTPLGVHAYITAGDNSGGVLDIAGVGEFLVTQNGANALALGAFIDPDALVLWRQHERLQLVYGEIDTDATPTADLRARIRAVRVRPQEGAPAPLRLVR